jgi:hypothetical protein
MKVPSDKEDSLVSIKKRYDDFLSMYRRMAVGPEGLIPDEGLAYRIYNGCLQVAKIEDNAITSTSYSLTEGIRPQGPQGRFIPNIVTTNIPIETNDATVLNTFLDDTVTPITDPVFVNKSSVKRSYWIGLEESSVSDENETPAGKAQKPVLGIKQINRIRSRQPIMA